MSNCETGYLFFPFENIDSVNEKYPSVDDQASLKYERVLSPRRKRLTASDSPFLISK